MIKDRELDTHCLPCMSSLKARIDKSNSNRRKTFPSSSEAETFRSGGCKLHWCGYGFAQDLLRFNASWSNMRLLTNHLYHNIPDFIHSRSDSPSSFFQHGDTWRANILGTICAEIASEIPQTCSGKQGIARCMRYRITVGVPLKARDSLPSQSGNPARTGFIKYMRVHPNANAWNYIHLGVSFQIVAHKYEEELPVGGHLSLLEGIWPPRRMRAVPGFFAASGVIEIHFKMYTSD